MYSISCLWLIKLADFLLGLPELWDGTVVGMYHSVTHCKGCFEDEQTVQHPRDQRSNMTEQISALQNLWGEKTKSELPFMCGLHENKHIVQAASFSM